MSYHILSKELSNPELKSILQALNSFFQSKEIDFYIVGATARDILLTNLYGLIPERKNGYRYSYCYIQTKPNTSAEDINLYV